MSRRKTAREKLFIEMMSTVDGVSALADMLADEGDAEAAAEARRIANLAYVFREGIARLKGRPVMSRHEVMVGRENERAWIRCWAETGETTGIGVYAFGDCVIATRARRSCYEAAIVRKCRDMLNAGRSRYAAVDPETLTGFARANENIWKDRYRWAIKCLAADNVQAQRSKPPRK